MQPHDCSKSQSQHGSSLTSRKPIKHLSSVAFVPALVLMGVPDISRKLADSGKGLAELLSTGCDFCPIRFRSLRGSKVLTAPKVHGVTVDKGKWLTR